jgi:hypothetical protein
MSHLHCLQIKPQIYVDLLEGDDQSPYYLYAAGRQASDGWRSASPDSAAAGSRGHAAG